MVLILAVFTKLPQPWETELLQLFSDIHVNTDWSSQLPATDRPHLYSHYCFPKEKPSRSTQNCLLKGKICNILWFPRLPRSGEVKMNKYIWQDRSYTKFIWRMLSYKEQLHPCIIRTSKKIFGMIFSINVEDKILLIEKGWRNGFSSMPERKSKSYMVAWWRKLKPAYQTDCLLQIRFLSCFIYIESTRLYLWALM